MTFFEFFQQNILLFAATIAVLGFLVFTEYRSFQTRGADLSPGGLSLTVNRGAKLIDLRRGDDFRTGHIAGAKNLPEGEIMQHLDSFDKDDTIVLYCYHGNISGRLVGQLRKQGFTQVSHLKGGINVWESENLPLTT